MTGRPVVEVAVLDVGQGDTIVVSIPSTGEAVVIDCVDVDAVFAYLRDRKITHLRGLVLTHLHLDHYREATHLLRNCERHLNLRCERLLYHWDRAATPADLARLLQDADAHGEDGLPTEDAARMRRSQYRELIAWAEQNHRACGGLAREEGRTCFSGTFGEVLELVHPWYAHLHRLSAHGLNNTSAVLRVRGAGTSALLTGDIEAAAWAVMTSQGTEELRADVLKFPHHGAWTEGDPDEILDTVQPTVVIVSVGTRGYAYDHPNHDVFTAIRQRVPQTRLLCTQATHKCGPVGVPVQRLAASSHTRQPDTFRTPRTTRALGCPCAGTVIVSLGATVEVLQPTIEFHQNGIIKPLLPNHQCLLVPEPPQADTPGAADRPATRLV